MQVTFGGYCLDLGTRQLLHGETEVRLSPKAFDLLHVLIDNRTRAVSKEELHDRLWKDTYVTEANLAVLVTELRRGSMIGLLRPGSSARCVDSGTPLRADR